VIRRRIGLADALDHPGRSTDGPVPGTKSHTLDTKQTWRPGAAGTRLKPSRGRVGTPGMTRARHSIQSLGLYA
jgi:hypothetical protein